MYRPGYAYQTLFNEHNVTKALLSLETINEKGKYLIRKFKKGQDCDHILEALQSILLLSLYFFHCHIVLEICFFRKVFLYT